MQPKYQQANDEMIEFTEPDDDQDVDEGHVRESENQTTTLEECKLPESPAL